MPPKRSRTHGANPNPEHEAASGSGSAPVDIDLPQGTPRDSGTELHGPVDTLFSRELAPLGACHSRSTTQAECEDNGEDGSSMPLSPVILRADDTRTAPDAAPILSMSSDPPNCFGGPTPTVPQSLEATQPAGTQQGFVAQTNLSISRTPTIRVQEAEIERTHLVWMPAGDIPSITCTSPTPPPAQRVPRRRSTLAPAHDAPGLSAQESSRRGPRPVNHSSVSEQDIGSDSVSENEDDDVPVPELKADYREISPRAADSPGPSCRRTLAEYDRTNARIRALNAELFNSNLRGRSHQYRTSAPRTPRTGVRYLNVPGAAVDALMTYRPRGSESTRRASSDGTGIVDISESESSEFESDEEDGDFERTFTPGGNEIGVGARSDSLVSHPERPERAAAIPAELLDWGTVAGPYSAITTPPVPTDGREAQWQRFRTDPFVHDHTSEDDRLQSERLPVLLQPEQDTRTSSTPLPPAPHRPGKKRVRGPDLDGDRVRAEGLAREDKRRKAAPGASASAT